MLKKIFLFVGILFILYLTLCFAGNANYKIERTTTINASLDSIKGVLYDFKEFQEKWSPFTKYDPEMKTTYTGKIGESGYQLSWESEKKEVGKGSLTYNYTNADTIMNTLHFDDYGDSKNYFILTQNEKNIIVTWGMFSNTPFVFRGMSLFINFEDMIAPDFEDGLKNLKQLIEKEN